MNKNNPEINICMITDDNYIMPTSVAIHSMIVNKGTGKYNFYIITSNLSEESEKAFKNFEREDVSVKTLKKDLKVFMFSQMIQYALRQYQHFLNS